MGSRPFDLGGGRNGPAPLLGQGRQKAAPPYRVDMSDEEFQAVGDIVVATLAPPRERTDSGIELPDAPSPFHVALAVGPKVAEKLGVELEVGDVFAMEGAAFADTLAGRVWFVRAEKVLAVVTRKSEEQAARDAVDLPPETPRNAGDTERAPELPTEPDPAA